MKFAARNPGPLLLRRLPEAWEPADFRRITLTACSPTLGARVEGVDLSQTLDAEVFAELDRALLEWKVLFFREQPLSEAAHAAFAERLKLQGLVDRTDVVRCNPRASPSP